MQDTKVRLPQLDGIRGLAVLMVVWWHYFNCQAAISFASPFWTKILWQSTSLSWSGVDLFFVLSGFLITGILLDESKARNFLSVFYLRRAARIFPLYFLVLALAGVMFVLIGNQPRFNWLFDGLPPISSLVTFTQNLVMGAQGSFGGGFLGMTWSLAVEEQFYILWPWVVLLCGGRGKLLFASIGLCLCAPLLRYNTMGLAGFVNMPHRMDSLLLGAIAAILVRNENFVAVLRAKRRYLYLVMIALLPGIFLMSRYNPVFGSMNHFILSLFFAAILLHCVIHTTGKMSRVLSMRWLRWCGWLSYAIYMFHQPIAGLLHGVILGTAPSIVTVPGLMITVLSVALVLVTSALSMHYFESPFLRWAHRFQYEKRTAAEADRKVPTPANVLAPAGS